MTTRVTLSGASKLGKATVRCERQREPTASQTRHTVVQKYLAQIFTGSTFAAIRSETSWAFLASVALGPGRHNGCVRQGPEPTSMINGSRQTSPAAAGSRCV
jgi:hypothetical protein